VSGEAPDDPAAAEPDRRAPGRVLDAGALRAVAHPLRFQLIETLIEHGPSTASELGRRLGESSGLMSYHLRQLAQHGLIEEAPELGSARDRWWRAVRGGYTLAGLDLLEQEQTRDDAQILLDEVVRARLDRLRRWHREAPAWGSAWVDAAAEVTARLRLTAEELAALTDELIAVLDRYRSLQTDRHGPGAARPPGAAPVTVQVEAFPTGDAVADEPDADAD
jgi:DNA-binding transcriptional ArsR family regulator